MANGEAVANEWRFRHRQQTDAPVAWEKADGGIVIDSSNPQMREAVERLAQTLPREGGAGGGPPPAGSQTPSTGPVGATAGAAGAVPEGTASPQTSAEPLLGGPGRGEVLAMGHYQRDIGGQKQPAFESLLKEAEAASGGHGIMLYGVAPDGKAQFDALAPSSLASSALVQQALTGETNVRAIYINVEAGPVQLLPDATRGPRGAEVGIGGSYQTGGEYRSLVAAMAAGSHKVDIYIRHPGGLSVVRSGSQQVEGAHLPIELRPHLPPSFQTEDPQVVASRAAAQAAVESQADQSAAPQEIRDEVTARLAGPQGQAGTGSETPTEPGRAKPEGGSAPRLTPEEEAAKEILPVEAAKPAGQETQATESPRSSTGAEAVVDPRVTAAADALMQAMASGGRAAVRQGAAGMSDRLLEATAAELFVQAQRATTAVERQRLSEAALAAWRVYFARPLPGERP
jgi:hypothetical protein